MSYDPSQWYSYSKNRPNEVPPAKKAVFMQQKSPEKKESDEGDAVLGPTTTTTENDANLDKLSTVIESKIDTSVTSETKNEPEHNRKLNNFVKRLQKMVRELPSAYKKKITYDVMTQLAQSLLDDTVFEIVKGLEDIQQLTERNLLNRRMKVLSEHKGQRVEMAKRHHSALQDCQSRPHQVKLLKREHSEERKSSDEKLERELNQIDQKLVLEIDQQVIDQQATLQRAGVPLFFITNKPEDVRLQMYLLDFITRLIPDS